MALGGLLEREARSNTLPGWISPQAMSSSDARAEPAHRGRPAMEVDEGHEQVHAAQGCLVGDADEADVAARAGRR
jgi:hypothetical protein